MSLDWDEEDPSLVAKSTATGSGRPEYSVSTTLPSVPPELLGAVTEKLALWVLPEQFERANHPWYGEVSVGECSYSRCQPAGVELTMPPAELACPIVTKAISVSPGVQGLGRLTLMGTTLFSAPLPEALASCTKLGVAAAATDSSTMLTAGTTTRSATPPKTTRRAPLPRRRWRPLDPIKLTESTSSFVPWHHS